MGRKSVKARTTSRPDIRRPEPPLGLTDDQASIWRETVETEAADFFRSNALKELLKDYCRHKATVAAIDAQISAMPLKAMMHPEYGKIYERLLKMRALETRAAADKATKLRLTNQSRYTPQAASTAAKRAPISLPWVFE